MLVVTPFDKNAMKDIERAILESDLGLLRRLMAGEIPSYHLEKRYIHADGHIVWALLSVSPVTGLTADQPAAAPTADIAISRAIKPTKIRTGSGSALPSRSTRSSQFRRPTAG